MITDKILDTIKNMDLKWFQKWEIEFANHEFYHPKDKMVVIINSYSEPIFDGDGNWIDSIEEVIENNFSISEFVWSYNNNINEYGLKLFEKVFKVIKSCLKDDVPIIVKGKKLDEYYKIIETYFNDILKNEDKEQLDYYNAIKYIKEKWLTTFVERSIRVKTLNEFSIDRTSQLYFDVNQNALVALVILLKEAKIISKIEDDQKIIKFISQNFVYKLGEKEYRKAEKISYQYYKLRNDRTSIHEGLTTILKMINSVKDNLLL